MMEPLSREQVEDVCRDITYEATSDVAVVNQLQYTDADLRAKLTVMTERAEKAEAQNEHYLYRKQTSELHDRLIQAQQEIERLHDQLTVMAERVAEAESIPVAAHNRIVAQTITAMDAERTSFEQEIERLKGMLELLGGDK